MSIYLGGKHICHTVFGPRKERLAFADRFRGILAPYGGPVDDEFSNLLGMTVFAMDPPWVCGGLVPE